MKLTKKQDLELTRIDFKSLVEQAWNKEVDLDIHSFGADNYTLWICRYTNVGITVSCIAGEPTLYWFDKRISPVELRGMMKGNPKTEYFVFRRGAKRPQYTILDAKKYRTLVSA